MLNKIINTIKNFLIILFIFLLIVMLFVKFKVYGIKKEIRDIEKKIIALDNERKILNLEITYLTRPERLKEIYNTMKNINYKENEKNIAKVEQIKDIKKLIPYYYVKNDNKNKVAKK